MLDSNRTKAHFNWHQKRPLCGRVESFLITWDVLLILFCDHNLLMGMKSFFTRILYLNLQRHSQFFMVLVPSACRKKSLDVYS